MSETGKVVCGKPPPRWCEWPSHSTTRDEIYTFNNDNTQNQVVLTCPPLGGGAPLPIAWYRNEGTGRVFYTAMGHGNEHWTASSALVNDHAVPAILWAAGQ